jgi:hypothetical protein
MRPAHGLETPADFVSITHAGHRNKRVSHRTADRDESGSPTRAAISIRLPASGVDQWRLTLEVAVDTAGRSHRDPSCPTAVALCDRRSIQVVPRLVTEQQRRRSPPALHEIRTATSPAGPPHMLGETDAHEPAGRQLSLRFARLSAREPCHGPRRAARWLSPRSRADRTCALEQD